MPDSVEPLIDVREDETFLSDKREVETALVYARRFATDAPLEDREQAGQLADAIKGLAGARKAAEKHKLGITEQWRTSTSHVNAHYKELLSTIDAAEKALKRKAGEFRRREEARLAAERKAEQERLDREAEERAEDAQAAAELAAEEQTPEAKQLAAEAHQEAAVAAVATPSPTAFVQPKQVRGDYAALGSRTEWRHELVDLAEVPDELKVTSLNDQAVKARIAAEKAAAKVEKRDFKLEIPGLRIYPHEIEVSR